MHDGHSVGMSENMSETPDFLVSNGPFNTSESVESKISSNFAAPEVSSNIVSFAEVIEEKEGGKTNSEFSNEIKLDVPQGNTNNDSLPSAASLAERATTIGKVAIKQGGELPPEALHRVEKLMKEYYETGDAADLNRKIRGSSDNIEGGLSEEVMANFSNKWWEEKVA